MIFGEKETKMDEAAIYVQNGIEFPSVVSVRRALVVDQESVKRIASFLGDQGCLKFWPVFGNELDRFVNKAKERSLGRNDHLDQGILKRLKSRSKLSQMRAR